jgi:hypothetical protein
MKSIRQYLEGLGRRGELLIPLSFLLVSAYLFYLAFRFRGAFVMLRQGVGPDFFPKVYTAIMMVFSLWLIYQAVKGKVTTESEKTLNPQNLWITIVFMVAYAFLLEIVGFVVLTPIWVAAYMIAIGMRRWTWLLATAVIFSAFMIIVFPRVMLIPLPRGIGIFREISLFIY